DPVNDGLTSKVIDGSSYWPNWRVIDDRCTSDTKPIFKRFSIHRLTIVFQNSNNRLKNVGFNPEVNHVFYGKHIHESTTQVFIGSKIIIKCQMSIWDRLKGMR